MKNLLNLGDFLVENSGVFDIEDLKECVDFTKDQIAESLTYLNSDDPAVLEAWYNSVLDFAALVPGVGSVAEGINLVSYAKQGEYLLAALCSIGLIPIFGQYIGAGGTLLVKALGKGAKLGKGLIGKLVNLIAKFFPKITSLFKSAKFSAKFKGIAPYTGKMLKSLEKFVMTGGRKLTALAKSPRKIRALKREAAYLKQGVKVGGWVIGGKNSGKNIKKIPVPQPAYMSQEGTPSNNIRPYTDMEISQAETSDDWMKYLM